MNKTSIEFCDFSWNVIVGCRNGCDYCWAKKFNDRYFKNNDFHVPKFYEERLNEKVPGLPKVRNYIAAAISPDKPVVFVVDMGDIFSKGVQEIWVGRIFEYIEDHPNANFLLLTKCPEIYPIVDIPKKNTFIGTSLDFAHNYKRVDYVRQMGIIGYYRTFVNIEPLMSRMDAVDFTGIDFITVGAMTGRKYRPDPAWHKSINHPVIYYKRNYTVYFPELIKAK
jgi:protein gp37